MAKEKKKDIQSKNVSKKKEVSRVPKEKFFTKIKKELKLVKWPTFKEIFKYTVATIVFCIILVLFFEVLNLLMAYIKGLFN